jgi:hypothetical protein
MTEQIDIIAERLTFLASAEPVEPFGWFRWIFDRYATRYRLVGDIHREKPLQQGWTLLAKNQLSLNQAEYREQWLSVLERHAWTAGLFGMIEAVMPNWERITPLAKGLFMAGFSDSENANRDIDQIIPHIHEAKYYSLSFCQLACNLVRYRKTEYLEAVFAATEDWNTTIEQLPAFDYELQNS